MKIRSTEELEDYIAREFAWRRKELTNLRNLALSAKDSTRNILLKACITTLYSHWEGFVKNTAIAYCMLLNKKKLKYSELMDSFKAYSILNAFKEGFPHKRFNSYLEVVNILNSITDDNLVIDYEKHIDAKSNLNSEVLLDIIQKLGLDYKLYELKEKLIDEIFLGTRNAISHGEYRDIDPDSFNDLYDEVTALINLFKNQILNATYTESYKSTNQLPEA